MTSRTERVSSPRVNQSTPPSKFGTDVRESSMVPPAIVVRRSPSCVRLGCDERVGQKREVADISYA